jgi:hypothetical protein
MRYGRGKLDMPHTLTPYFAFCNLYAAPIAHHTFIAYAFVFAAMALPVLLRPKYALAKKAVALGFKRPIIYRFRFLYLAARPLADFFGRCQTYLYGIESY